MQQKVDTILFLSEEQVIHSRTMMFIHRNGKHTKVSQAN